ncbi:hypothetical protein BDA96_01G240300 [Sorghum bicolor]|uniref:Uncharacterized protein n=1 Tax=Sorghum bicolor TaxID=4558 RepID=A0A921V149_SORBI|nr:hypothetical protein BDA96_01G240300 [Sorghum bicolor]
MNLWKRRMRTYLPSICVSLQPSSAAHVAPTSVHRAAWLPLRPTARAPWPRFSFSIAALSLALAATHDGSFSSDGNNPSAHAERSGR